MLYSAKTVAQWLTQDPSDFVFTAYFPETTEEGTPLQLCSFVLGDTGYLNPDSPDVLITLGQNALVANGPIQVTTNMVSAEALGNMISPNPGDNDFLLFIPELDLQQRVFYNIYSYTRTDNGGVKGGDGTNTNPSPPAMPAPPPEARKK